MFVHHLSGASNLICDFHRKQAWVRWCSALKNNVTDQETVLKMLNVRLHFFLLPELPYILSTNFTFMHTHYAA